MTQEQRIADLRALLAAKLEQRDAFLDGRNEMPGFELHELEKSILEDEETLRAMGVDDV